MTNETFLLMSEEEKSKKFKGVLKSKTDNCLTDDEMRIIICNLLTNTQYTVRTYKDGYEFLGIIALSNARNSRTLLGSVVPGASPESNMFFNAEHTAAVITKKHINDSDEYCIHIYLPPQRVQRRCCYE